MNRRIALALAVTLALGGGACSHPAPSVNPPSAPARSKPSVATAGAAAALEEPRDVTPPQLIVSDSPRDRAARLGQFMETRWPRIHLTPDANALGTVAAFGIVIDYDHYSGNDLAWEQSIHQVAGDMREASVELLQLAVQYFPDLKYATVWEDSRLMYFWSKRQIKEMGPAWMYRDFHAYQVLTRLAKYQPPLLSYARDHAAPPPPGLTQ